VRPSAAVRACARGSGGRRLRTDRADRQYRSRLEILRDFLDATRDGGKKTRIIGLANLNPSSFQSYLDYCLALRLVQDTPVGYRLTPRADVVLDAIERLLARSAEVDAALLSLQQGCEGTVAPGVAPKGALRYVSRLAWNEVVRSATDSLAAEAGKREDRIVDDLRLVSFPAWSRRDEEGEPEGPRIGRPLRPDSTSISSASVPRGRVRG